jgi:hypothetical protein
MCGYLKSSLSSRAYSKCGDSEQMDCHTELWIAVPALMPPLARRCCMDRMRLELILSSRGALQKRRGDPQNQENYITCSFFFWIAASRLKAFLAMTLRLSLATQQGLLAMTIGSHPYMRE